ncbi:MAG: hypothetical protein DRQ88_00560 [Epsilonproteobacteria bacterium]|nr:MAG: hypothetical protein DRQ89_03640 [Campylobacterota bacterium]RLA68127.1 MAG: hypothetical protein DRQ88_00560 [Campylobacterota bacterium]
MNVITLILAIFFIPSAFGIVQYPYLYPIGDVESLMSNTGVGLRKSRGGAAYNPASLSRLTGADISASASTYNVMDSKTSTAEGLKSFKGFAPIPNMVFSGTQFSWGYGALTALVPTNIEVSTRYEIWIPEENTYGNLIFTDKVEELILGLSAGIPLNDNWAIGMNLYAHVYGESSTEGLIFLEDDAPVKGGARNRQLKNSVYSLQPIIGVHHSPWNEFFWGLRIQFPTIKITGSGTIYEECLFASKYCKDFDNNGSPDYDQKETEYDTDYQVPFDFVLGFNFKPWKNHRFLLDLGYQLATEFEKFPGLVEYDVKTKNQGRGSFGYWWNINEQYSLLVGLKWNPSPKIENDIPSSLPPINFFGGSLGIYKEGKVTTTGVGFYYYKSRTDHKMWGEVDDPSRVILWGLILTSGIRF